MSVTHEPDESRFVFTDDAGAIAGEVTYEHDGEALVLTKAEIWPDRQGQGLGVPLVRQTLEMIRKQDLGPIRPQCPFIAKFMMKNPEFSDLSA
jgi:predicted GNAT family acetyltransferase